MSNRLKVGIIGFGKMGQIRKTVIENHPVLSLTAVCDPVPPPQANQGWQVFRDYRKLLKADINAVWVCTPNKFTPEIVIAALNSGKHVFCEKPPGRNPEDIKNIIKAEKKNSGLKLKFGFNHRYHGAITEAKSIIESSRLGKILWVRGIYGKSGETNPEKSWRNRREIAGGGILLDQGIHMIDLFRMFCGDFGEIKSLVTNSFWGNDVEDNAMAIMRNKRGQIAMLHSSSTQWKHTFSLEIALEKGYVNINGILSSTASYGQGEKLIIATRQSENGFAPGNPREEMTYFNRDLSWELETSDFVDCIKNDRPVTTGSSRDALKAMEMVYRIYAADRKWHKEPVE